MNMLGMRSMAAAPRCLGRAARPLTAVSTRGTQVRVAAAAADKDPLELAANAKGQTTKSSESSGPKTYENANIGDELVAEYGIVGKNAPSGRRAGVILHPTSLPGPYGSGDLGPECFKFIDWLESAGMKAWQVLPLVPPDEDYFSPYSGLDALCGNPLLLSLDALVTAGLLEKSDLPASVPVADADFPAVFETKMPLVNKAAKRMMSDPDFELMRKAAREFSSQNEWLNEAALFDAIRRYEPECQCGWWEWPQEIRLRDGATLDKLKTKYSTEIDSFVGVQHLFNEQWSAIKEHANKKGIIVIGDMPIYVGGQSADVWANQALFDLGPDGAPKGISGVPPDAFSETGQLWGSPLYDWPAHDREGYQWWAQRLGRAAEVYDETRIDHFRAFAGYWACEAGAETAMGGVWKKGPGKAIFDGVDAALGDRAPVIMAEDLGVITEDVKELRKAIGAPGMVVLQFAFGGGPDNTHLPHNHYANSFVYPGTHDNETVAGWWKDSANEEEKKYLLEYLGVEGTDIAWEFIQACMASVSGTCMIMMQDVMALDNSHRMNSPGQAAGNWAWRVGGSDTWDKLGSEAAKLRELATMYDRFEESEEVQAAAKAAGEAAAAEKTTGAAKTQQPAGDITSLE